MAQAAIQAPLPAVVSQNTQQRVQSEQVKRLADALPIERAASRWIVSSDPDEHIEKIKPYIDMGFRHLVFHAPGNDQARFLKIYGEMVLPKLRKRFG